MQTRTSVGVKTVSCLLLLKKKKNFTRILLVATYVATYVESMGCSPACSHLLQLSRHRQTAGELSWVISHVACIGYLKRIVVVSSESIVA